MGDNRWRSLLSGLTEIVEWHKDGMVIIGGIAEDKPELTDNGPLTTKRDCGL